MEEEEDGEGWRMEEDGGGLGWRKMKMEEEEDGGEG